MPKFLEVAKLISGKINSNEFSAALAASDPMAVDIEEGEFDKIKAQIGGMMTLESAVNNVEVAKAMKPKLKEELGSDMRRELKSSIYTTIEDKVAGIGQKLGVDLSGKKIDDQLALIIGAKVPDPVTPDNTAYTKLQEEFGNFKVATEKDKENHLESFNDFKINSTLRTKISSIPLSKAYQDDLVRESLYDRVVTEVRAKASIQLDDKTGQMKLLNPENREMELFDESNNKIGLEDLINPLMQPYLQATPPKPESKRDGIIEDLPDGLNAGSAAAMVRSAAETGVKY